jgi:hypothetical protein
MISIEKLIQNISQCKDTNLTLGIWNDDSVYIQKNAVEIRRNELESLESIETIIQHVEKVQYTMDQDLLSINHINTNTYNSRNSSNGRKGSYTSRDVDSNFNGSTESNEGEIPSKSLIVYMENEAATLPEILITMLKGVGVNLDDWYLYGVKNPESFYKCFMLLTKMDFIIKNKTEKKNEVATFKREMAMHYETFYKELEYRKLRFPKFEMIHNLTNTDNYTGYDAIKYTADYNQYNIIILDIIKMQYINVNYTPNKIINTDDNIGVNSGSATECGIIIKYANNTYIPLMNSTGKHTFNLARVIGYLIREFEEIRKTNIKSGDMPESNEGDDGSELNDTTQFYNLQIAGSGVDASDSNSNSNRVGSFDYGMGSGMSSGIIKNDKNRNITFAIEDMIEIEEQEAEPIGIIVKDKAREKVIEPVINPIIEKPIMNSFDRLMEQIPMGKGKKAEDKKPNKPVNLDMLLNSIPADAIQSTGTDKDKGIDKDDELKPIGKYTLGDLQILAKIYKVDTQKAGKTDKKINKTKQELYDEILAKQKK